MNRFEKKYLVYTALIVLAAFFFVPFTSQSKDSSSNEELSRIKKQFGAVLNLTGNAAKQINAIANLLTPGSGMMSINLAHSSGELCMLEPETKRYMVHFSQNPEKTTEDILYFINPETLIKSGLDVNSLPPHPTELGKMKPFQWYYYSGKTHEPHHGRKLGKEFLVMTFDVK